MGKPKNKSKGGLLKKMIILGAIHAVVTIGLIVYSTGGSVVLFGDPDPSLTGNQKTVATVASVLMQPAYSVWNTGLLDSVPQFGNWILFGANSLVWGQALLDHGYVEVECSHNYATVVFSGRVTFLESLEDKWHAMSLMTRQLDPNAETMIANRNPESLKDTVVGRIDIEYMSGKKSQEVDV